MQSQPWAMAAVALLVVGVGLLSVRERHGPGSGALDGRQVATTEEPKKEIEATQPPEEPSEPAAPTVAEEERIAVAEAEPQRRAPKKQRRRRKREQSVEPSAGPTAQEEPPPLVVAEAPSQPTTAERAEQPSGPTLAPSMKGPPASANALTEDGAATTASEHKRKICNARVTTLEKMIARKADYEPAPEEQLAVGRCYNLLGNEDKAKYWLDRAAKHPDTQAAAERELRKLGAN